MSVEQAQTGRDLYAAQVINIHQTAPQAASPSPLHQLPPNPLDHGFVGREADLEKLRKLNPEGGAVLTGLRGMGGIGKTALGLVLAHEWAARFPDAQLFLDGRGTQPNPPSGADLIAQVIQAFHPTDKPPEGEAALKSMYRDLLHGKRVLLFLDNALDAAQAIPLIPPAGCGLIVTSRRSIMLGNRAPYAVDRLPDPEAIALLREYHPALSDAEAAELVKLCAGLPLALRLAGAHLGLEAAERPAGPDVKGFLQRFRASPLGTLDADAEGAALTTITESLRLSEDQLPEAERTSWRRLGVFTASFDARAAEAIVGANVTMLGHFVRRSLLECEGTDRFKLHDLAADYARGRLEPEALEALRLTHAEHYTVVGRQADALYLKGEVVSGLALFDRERAQIEAAYGWLVGRTDEGAAKRLIALVGAVVYTSNLRFHPHQCIAWLESQLRAARLCQDRRGEGNALGNLGNAHAALGDARKAIGYYEQRMVIAREIGDRRGEGNALGNLGNAHADLGDARKAIEYHEQALVVSREIGDRHGEGQDLGNLGNAHDALGDARKAIEYYEQQLVITREIGDRRGEGNALWNSALAYDSLGNRAEAITRATAALTIFEAIESPYAARVRAALAKWREEGGAG
ncbi:MAG: tetratricopeptide repeat protein [Verrucomicrobia bacterium]|nr:tetratricopeptide repeat protein [Verrucomicrobiota bacterium]